MLSSGNIQTILLIAAPFIWVRLRSLYHQLRTPHTPRPIPPATSLALKLLYITSILAYLSHYCSTHQENYFRLTSSSLTKTSAEILLSRLRSINPTTIREDDTLLWRRLESKDGRIAYARFGAEALRSCTWCRVDKPETFLWFILPPTFAVHIAHIVVLYIATSRRIPFLGSNRAAHVWQVQSIMAAFLIMFYEIYQLGQYPSQNLNSTSPQEDIYTYEQALSRRGILIALLDGTLGFVVNLTSSGRLGGFEPRYTHERLEDVGASLERSLNGVISVVCLKQPVMREPVLRRRNNVFWEEEEAVKRKIMMDPAVVAARREVEGRPGWGEMKEEARRRASAIMRGLYVKREVVGGDSQGESQSSSGGTVSGGEESQSSMWESQTTQSSSPEGGFQKGPRLRNPVKRDRSDATVMDYDFDDSMQSSQASSHMESLMSGGSSFSER